MVKLGTFTFRGLGSARKSILINIKLFKVMRDYCKPVVVIPLLILPEKHFFHVFKILLHILKLADSGHYVVHMNE